MTVFKPVPGTNGMYKVSDDGQVMSLKKKTPRILKHNVRHGYPCVDIYYQAKRVQKPVHVLILEAFVGPRPEGMLALHNDDDKANCCLSNLRWGTRSDNTYDRFKNKGGFKLTEFDAAWIKFKLAMGWKQHELAKEFEVDQALISKINTGKYWSFA